MLQTEPGKSRHVELILRQIDTLPTLPAVATRLLQLTASDESNARQVIDLLQTDQALTAKVLSLCRQSHRGVRSDTLTVDKAVMLLGFNAVRNAVLSIKVIEVFSSAEAKDVDNRLTDDRDNRPATRSFDRIAFWRHCLAVATAAELIVQAHPAWEGDRSEAFVCGLLHDIGKLALDHILPKAYSRVTGMVDLNQGNIAEYERKIIGLDHHTAGKRLAEQWQLPVMLQDCIWLHGSPYSAVPNLEHRRMIGLISLADLLARQQHIGYSGNLGFPQDMTGLCESLGLNPQAVADCGARLHEQVQQRSVMLGVDEEPSRELFLESIQHANEVLGRMNLALERRTQATTAQERTLSAIAAFNTAVNHAGGVQDVLDTIARSAIELFGPGFYGTLYQNAHDDEHGNGWLMCQYNADGRTVRSQWIDPPPHTPELSRFDPAQPMSMDLMGLLPWIADYLADAPDMRTVRLLPLGCSSEVSAILLHDRGQLLSRTQIDALISTWGIAIGSVARTDAMRRMGEELAESNRELADAQQRLCEVQSMARLGEMAAGAAHEMNNPLAVIAGRSQLLAMGLNPGSEQQRAAQAIQEQAHKLSNLITSLRLFSDPPQPQLRTVDISSLLDQTVRSVRKHLSARESDTVIDLQIKQQLPHLRCDPDQISHALTEMVCNAVQSGPRRGITVAALVDDVMKQLLIRVTDDGCGMDAHTLAHAVDPFFSVKQAGRRVGMGLTRAQQLVQLHGGRIELRSSVQNGTVATIILPLKLAYGQTIPVVTPIQKRVG